MSGKICTPCIESRFYKHKQVTTADPARTKRGEQRVHGQAVLGDHANSEQ